MLPLFRGVFILQNPLPQQHYYFLTNHVIVDKGVNLIHCSGVFESDKPSPTNIFQMGQQPKTIFTITEVIPFSLNRRHPVSIELWFISLFLCPLSGELVKFSI